MADEFDLISRYFSGLTKAGTGVIRGIGDDAAVLEVPQGLHLLVSTDRLQSGVHFPADAEPYDIGYKALAVNLSDLAAMAADARWVTLALSLPEVDEAWLGSFCAGFADLANRFQVALVGGDLGRGVMAVTVQAMGVAPVGESVMRSGARPGDRIYISGVLGCAGYALHCLDRGVPAPPDCMEKLVRPVPRLDLVPCLRDLASSAIDISDGLVSDLQHILTGSGVGADIHIDRIPCCQSLAEITDPGARLALMAAAGDDYELCFTAPAKREAELLLRCKEFGTSVTGIGTISEGNAISWYRSGNEVFGPEQPGYRHF